MISDEGGKNMKKNDWLLAGGILAVCVIFFAVHFLRHREGEGQAVISVSGEEYAVYSLSADRTVSIGDTNRLIIENGTVKMEWADCPDQICVSHRQISRDGESIICLPNQVVVTIQSSNSSEIDGVAQ